MGHKVHVTRDILQRYKVIGCVRTCYRVLMHRSGSLEKCLIISVFVRNRSDELIARAVTAEWRYACTQSTQTGCSYKLQ